VPRFNPYQDWVGAFLFPKTGNARKKTLKKFLPYLDDILYLIATICAAIGFFTSPFPFLGWLAISAALYGLAWMYAKGSAK
jgi:hypothetical protein